MNPESQTPLTDAAKFTVRWSPINASYLVSIPRYNGGEVVPADQMAALETRNAELVAALTDAIGLMDHHDSCPVRMDFIHGLCDCRFMKRLGLAEKALAGQEGGQG